ncbi:MAG: hypothetical protein P4L46_19550 [Fimbriimonas sp.]|nr:hypothetical protein [Fimbriimonas sp.]
MKQPQSFFQTAKAIAYPVWLRNKRTYIGSALGLAVTILAAYAVHFGADQIPPNRSGEVAPTVFIQYLLAVVVLFISFNLAGKAMSVWEMGTTMSASPEIRELVKARQAQNEATYGAKGILPAGAVTFPVSTRDLALAPLFIGVLHATAAAILYAVFVVLPLRLPIPVVLPTLALALLVCASQGGAWMIAERSGAGCLFTATAIVGPMLLGIAWVKQVPEPALSAVAALLIVWAIRSTLATAPLMRHSASAGRALPVDVPSKPTRDPLQNESTFPSAMKAQVWAHLAGRAYIGMAVLVGMLCFVVFVYCLISDATPSARIGVGDIRIGTSALLFLLCLPGGILVATMFASNSPMTENMPGGGGPLSKGISGFFIIRPMSSVRFVAARLIANIKSTLAASWVLAACMILWLLVPGRENGREGTLLELLVAHASVRGLLLATLCVGGYVLSLWCVLAGDPLRAIFGRRKGEYYSMGPIMIAVIGWQFIRDIPGGENTPTAVLVATGVGLALIAVKAAVAMLGIYRLRHRNLVSVPILVKGAGVYVGIWLAFVAAFGALLPTDQLPLSLIAIVVALILPANRILWQILAFDDARHQ